MDICLQAESNEMYWLWHRRLGYSNSQSIHILSNTKLVKDTPFLQECKDLWGTCQLGKKHKSPFPKDGAWRATRKLELVHIDVCGPMKTRSMDGNKYLILFIDDFLRMTWVYFMREKSQVFSIFLKWKNFVKNQSGYSLKISRTIMAQNILP